MNLWHQVLDPGSHSDGITQWRLATRYGNFKLRRPKKASRSSLMVMTDCLFDKMKCTSQVSPKGRLCLMIPGGSVFLTTVIAPQEALAMISETSDQEYIISMNIRWQ